MKCSANMEWIFIVWLYENGVSIGYNAISQ